MSRCCIVGCFNTSKNSKLKHEGIKFYNFPTDSIYWPWLKDKRKEWINIVKKYTRNPTNFIPTKGTVICNVHFIGNKKSENPLHPSYLPTIFPNRKLEEHLDQKLQRFERHKRRRQQAKSNPKKKMVKLEPIEPLTKSIGCQSILCENEKYTPYFICNLSNVNGVCTAAVQANKVKKIQENKNCKLNISAVNVLMKDFGCDPLNLHSQSVHCPGFHGIKSMKSEEELISLTGVTFSVFELLLGLLPEFENATSSKETKLLITLMKLKTGLHYSALSVILQIDIITVQRTFEAYLFLLQDALKKFIIWPTKSTVQENMPESYKLQYPNTHVIIDCIEIHTECPPTIEQQVHMYSEYKHSYTVKFLVACTPCGYISFVSKCYAGRSSDCFVTSDCGLINLLKPGDTVLAQQALPEIKSSFDKKGANLVMLPFRHEPQFSGEEVEETASVQIHIEKIIQRIKNFRIFDKIPINLLQYKDLIVHVVCALVNIENPIINQPTES